MFPSILVVFSTILVLVSAFVPASIQRMTGLKLKPSLGMPDADQQSISSVNYMAKNKAPEPEPPVEKEGEKKYAYAGALVVFGVLWDFFITHGGQPYLAHPQ
jgi:hypothetical protein